MSYSIPSFGKGTICSSVRTASLTYGSSEALGLTEGGSGQEGIVCRKNARPDGALMGSSPTCASAHRANPGGFPVFRPQFLHCEMGRNRTTTSLLVQRYRGSPTRKCLGKGKRMRGPLPGGSNVSELGWWGG